MEVLVHNDLKVRELYEAFNRGDVGTILSEIAPQFTFYFTGAPDIPHGHNYKGREGAQAFFTDLDKYEEVLEFTPKHYFEESENGHNMVVSTGVYRGKVRSTGKTYETNWCHVWEFDEDGHPLSCSEILDTLTVAKAYIN
ncbi:nuclear transport factor 2 family protein [Solitalea lacus]|uniref:nuclear transport factor 2 family protein n=1 Tax=Solitalea lacus TaxID=2911172 RepID=UPI001EDA3768|nr:nuclear transport factor 2 family protein [Solitalea lacus]UKJ06548.1 nuclear transport factor 2 family protein [Solitalea lacus]